jgi:hypothetical protein
MAVVAITSDNLRIAEANITNDTGTWGNDGGGGGVADEPDFYYQGGGGALTSQSRKISTTAIGREYTHGSGTDLTATNRRHVIFKIQATNKDALLTRSSPALHVKIGSSSANYDTFYLFGSDNYPKRGGWQIIPVSNNVSGYRDATTATAPTRTSILYWSLLADFSAGSKSENVMIDAIDIGAGLNLVGGDGVSADGVFQDFIDADEGTVANSYGYVFTEGGVLFISGRLSIGRNTTPSAVATEFTDSDKTLVWNNGLVETGFNELLWDLGGSGTVVDLTRVSFKSIGKQNNDGDRGYTTTEDSRAIFTVVNTTGTLTMTNCNIDNFASVDLNDQCTLASCAITNSGQVDATVAGTTGADLNGCSILASTVVADSSALVWNVNSDPNGELNGMNFSKGANSHHAIEFGASAPLTMTLNDWTTTGFNATDAQTDSTFLLADRGSDVTWTINVVNSSGNFSYKKARATDTVNIVIDPVTTLVVVSDGRDNSPLQSSRVLVTASSGAGDLPYQDSVTITRVSTTASVSHTAHGMLAGNKILIKGSDQLEYNGVKTISNVTTNAYDFTVSGSPTTPATGTIVGTGVVIDGETDVNGEIQDVRTWSSPQPIAGKARRGSATPFFKTGSFTGTISTTNGFNQGVTMIIDE